MERKEIWISDGRGTKPTTGYIVNCTKETVCVAQTALAQLVSRIRNKLNRKNDVPYRAQKVQYI
jgi:hypothetical protein